MEVRFSTRENGACPVCRRVNACPLRDALAKSVSHVRDPGKQGLEIVIYACPRFVEKS
jgi:hypothetical protein